MSTPELFERLHRWDTNGELASRLAFAISVDLAEAIRERGSATLAVSGGSTPKPLFEQLSRRPLDWSRVTVRQVDERRVDESHSHSNARLIREHLLQNLAAGASFVSMKNPAVSPFGAELASADKLSAFAGNIDVVVLGMRADGHTASFFPAAPTLARALDPAGRQLCVAVRPPQAPHDPVITRPASGRKPLTAYHRR
jgi:6-phosphogluconolactonase